MRMRDALQDALERAEGRDYEALKVELRKRERWGDPDEDGCSDWDRSDAGYPLGRGYPPGAPLRDDSESHRQAWMRILRGDPCAYCGSPTSGTVDHISPVSGRGHDRHKWHNYTGSCETCNGSKANVPLLEWLARRGVLAAPARHPLPERARPAHVTIQTHSRTPAKDRRRRREAAGLSPGCPRPASWDLGHLVGDG